MLLLTWHGTILRVEQAQPRLIHVPLVPPRAVSTDYVLDLPENLPAHLPLSLPGGLTVQVGPEPGTVLLRRDGMYLNPDKLRGTAAFDRPPEANEGQCLLPVTPVQVAVLRTLLAGAWLQPDPKLPPFILEAGFTLRCGAQRLDLLEAMPHLAAPGGLHVPFRGAPRTLTIADVPPHAPEIHLRRLAEALPGAASVADLQALPDSCLDLPPSETLYVPPLMPSLPERDWVLDHAVPAPAPVGMVSAQARVMHHANAFVLLAPGLEGTVLGAAGLFTDPSVLDGLEQLPDYMAREGSEIFLSAAFLQGAPLLRGPHAIFYQPGLEMPYNWLIDCLVPLCALLPFLPPDVTLLLPEEPGTGEIAATKRAWMRTFGLGRVKRNALASPICVAEALYCFDTPGIGALSPQAVRAASDRAIGQLSKAEAPPAGQAARRIFLLPPLGRAILNLKPVENVARAMGLEVISLAGMRLKQRVALFRDCELVVAVSGDDLASVLFCRPGTAVLELSPAAAFHTRIGLLAAKLDLVHAVLPCPTAGNFYESNLTVPPARFRPMLELVCTRAGLKVAAP